MGPLLVSMQCRCRRRGRGRGRLQGSGMGAGRVEVGGRGRRGTGATVARSATLEVYRDSPSRPLMDARRARASIDSLTTATPCPSVVLDRS